MEDANCAGHSRKTRRESASSNNYSEISESVVKHRKMYVDYLKDKSRQTCIIYHPDHSSDECKFLGDFGSKYSKSRSTKERGHDPATETIIRQK